MAVYARHAPLLNRSWSNLFQPVFLIAGATAWMTMAMPGSYDGWDPEPSQHGCETSAKTFILILTSSYSNSKKV